MMVTAISVFKTALGMKVSFFALKTNLNPDLSFNLGIHTYQCFFTKKNMSSNDCDV